MRASLFITCNISLTHSSVRISEEGNTLGLDKKKTTAVGSASYCFGDFTVLVLILSLRKLWGFLLYGFPKENYLCLLSLVLCLCFIVVHVILSVKILT